MNNLSTPFMAYRMKELQIDAKVLHHISNVLCMYSNKPYSVASFESKSKQCVRSMIFLKRQEANGQKLMKIKDNQRKHDISYNSARI